MVAKLDEVGAHLDHWQAEALKSFEEGYAECCAHLVGVDFDVKKHSFECYLADLEWKVDRRGTGSSNQPGNDDV